MGGDKAEGGSARRAEGRYVSGEVSQREQLQRIGLSGYQGLARVHGNRQAVAGEDEVRRLEDAAGEELNLPRGYRGGSDRLAEAESPRAGGGERRKYVFNADGADIVPSFARD